MKPVGPPKTVTVEDSFKVLQAYGLLLLASFRRRHIVESVESLVC